ncbi:MAG: hypothetical protein M3256_09325, partial [Actinomycetota bacterium]|nr:hypothetical protein [Actinomycetota bacterium]
DWGGVDWGAGAAAVGEATADPEFAPFNEEPAATGEVGWAVDPGPRLPSPLSRLLMTVAPTPTKTSTKATSNPMRRFACLRRPAIRAPPVPGTIGGVA